MSRPWWLAACATTAALATFALRYLAFESFSNDHFQHLARAQQILFGAWQVRDYAESGLPLAAGLSAAAQLAFGGGLHAEVIWIAAAFAAAAGLSVVAGSLASGSVLLGLAGAAVTVAAAPVSYSYPKLLPYAAGFVAAWAYAARPDLPRLVALAAVVVAAFLLRHDHGMILGVGAAAAVAVAQRGVGPAARAVGTLTLAGVLLAGPYLLWVQAYEGLDAYVAEAMALSRREAEKADWRAPAFAVDRTRPWFAPAVEPWRPVINVRWTADTAAPLRETRERAHGLARQASVGPGTWQYAMSRWSRAALRGIVEDPAVADTQGIRRSELVLDTPAPGAIDRLLMRLPLPAAGLRPRENGAAVVYYAAWIVPGLALAAAWPARRRLAPPVRALVVMAVVVQLMMSWSMLRDPLVTRVRDVVAPLAVLLPFLAARLRGAAPSFSARLAAAAATAAGFALLLWAPAAAAGLGEQLENARILEGPRAVRERVREIRAGLAPPRERTGRVESPAADYLGRCTPPSSRIFGMTFAPEIFFYANRRFAGGHESLLPGFYDAPRQVALMQRRLAAEDVPYVMMDSETAGELAASYAPVVAGVRARYREVARFPMGGEKQLIVLADAARRSVRDYGPQNLPCFW